jgi:hypothetical protein
LVNLIPWTLQINIPKSFQINIPKSFLTSVLLLLLCHEAISGNSLVTHQVKWQCHSSLPPNRNNLFPYTTPSWWLGW